MAKKKYYAVKKGKATGIFETWDECRRNVQGVSGASYKSFYTYEEAAAFMDLPTSANATAFTSPRIATDAEASSGMPDAADISVQAADTNALVAYVDGSFSAAEKKYSFGCVLITPEGEIFKESGWGSNPKALANRNVAGELDGAAFAVKWAVENGFKRIILRHDYEGISKWHTGEWQAKSYSAKAYLDSLSKYAGRIEISFEKVRAHSGDHFNEMADQLAGECLRDSKL